jgi:transcription elongation factor Elf1
MNISIVNGDRHVCNFCGSDNLLFVSEQNLVKIKSCGICGRQLEMIDEIIREKDSLEGNLQKISSTRRSHSD